jgi:leukotriene-A4 hydrolase
MSYASISQPKSTFKPNSRVYGEVRIHFQVLADILQITLDTNKLSIMSVTDDQWHNLDFDMNTERRLPDMGVPLDIKFPNIVKAGSTKVLNIKYIIEGNNNAIQWVVPENTAGKVSPMFYTQGGATYARSILPCQDTPSIKVPIKGRITVPKPYLAIASGLFKYSEETATTITYFYEPNHPIATYLVSIIAGALEGKTITDRSTLYAEKEIIESSWTNFSDIERYLTSVI